MFKLSKEERLHREVMRGNYAADAHWYGLMCHWGQEAKLRDQLQNDLTGPNFSEILLPELVAAERDTRSNAGKLLFSGYLFLHCRMHDDLYLAICKYPKIYQILGRGFRIPSRIADAEIRQLKGVLETLPRPQMVSRAYSGHMVEVITGLMTGLRGRLVEVTAARVKIETSFSFLGVDSGVVVNLPQSSIRLIAAPEESRRLGRQFDAA